MKCHNVLNVDVLVRYDVVLFQLNLVINLLKYHT